MTALRSHNCESGFTMIELLVVMAIMVMMIGVSVVGYLSLRRGAEVRGAAASVKSTLMLARQYAITKHESVELQFNTTAMSVVILRSRANVKTVQLPRGVRFVDPTPASEKFYPSGVAGAGGTSRIKVEESPDIEPDQAKRQFRSIKLWKLTGVSVEE